MIAPFRVYMMRQPTGLRPGIFGVRRIKTIAAGTSPVLGALQVDVTQPQ